MVLANLCKSSPKTSGVLRALMMRIVIRRAKMFRAERFGAGMWFKLQGASHSGQQRVEQEFAETCNGNKRDATRSEGTASAKGHLFNRNLESFYATPFQRLFHDSSSEFIQM